MRWQGFGAVQAMRQGVNVDGHVLENRVKRSVLMFRLASADPANNRAVQISGAA